MYTSTPPFPTFQAIYIEEHKPGGPAEPHLTPHMRKTTTTDAEGRVRPSHVMELTQGEIV
jgi:hypothetical protein